MRFIFLCVMLAMSLAARAQQQQQQQQQAPPQQQAAPQQQEEGRPPADRMSPGTFMGLRLRAIGPAMTSGRIAALAVDPTDKRVWWIASASGGVWKTTNAGTTFTPVFDNEGSYSIGAVAIDPKNTAVVWVGAGENNSQRSVGYGDGLYRTEDAGRSWRNMGLKNSEHIARILIDPRNSDVVYVAAQGPLWGPGGDRGLYKTTDGGKTWKKLFETSENTGVTDAAFDPTNPDVLYAAAYQRRRHFFTLINGGPESAIYKSPDAGATWAKLRSGLPAGDIGRIGLAVSPADPRVIYATIEAAERRGGIFRSADRGATWERRNEFDASAMYYGKIFADPKDKDRIFVMNVTIMFSEDGGRTVRALGSRSKHVDNHAMWIDPDNTEHFLVGCDGGLYESFDNAATWDFKENLPITQFYNVWADNSAPFYYVYGGTQDNFSVGGPSRTRSASGIVNGDWFVTQGGDGFRSVVDPEDPNTVYAESQNGGLVRFDRRTGERMGLQPDEGKGEPPLRWNWDAPFIISPHSHTRLYFGANILFRSDDRGDTWKKISGELSRGLDRNKLPVMGKIWGPDAVAKSASTAFYGNASVVAESPKKEGLLFVGTDDGLVQITENGGQSWRKIDKIPGVPENAYVTHILPSQHDVNTVYVLFNNHQNADFAPYILKSTDLGKTWTSLKAELPANSLVWVLAEDHVNPNLLFLGTEFGLYFTINGGQKWVRLRGGFPTIAVRDLAIQKRENDLAVATFGRGFYILDDYTPLRALKPETLNQDAQLFAVKDAPLYIEASPLGGRGKSMQGESFFTASNPPFGATFTYYLKDALRTKKQMRQQAEREAERKGQAISYPTPEQLREEEEEEAPAIILTVTDAAGNVVRRLSGPASPGIHRVTWDLRFPATSVSAQPGMPGREEEPAEGPPQPPSSYLVMPGTYKVSVAKRVAGVAAQLAGPVSFNVVVEGVAQMAEADRKALFEFQAQVARLQRAVTGASDIANTTRTRLGLIKRALQETPGAENKLREEAQSLEKRLNAILISLRGDTVLRQRNENVPTSISQRVMGIVGDQRMSTAKPTQTQRDAYRIAAEEFTQELGKLRQLVEVDLVKLEKALEAAGAPYTPGRLPEWKEK
jgi:photosystem II stability/assembly factor-like uncharacterized protein